MESVTPSADRLNSREDLLVPEAYASGISWAAVIAGAFVTAALWLILLALGVGIGLSSVSPWSNVGASAAGIGAAAIIWMIVVQFIASSMGGYLAGRLRTKWATIHTDEVYFRDTAHGFLAWSVGLVITAAFLASAAASIVGSTQSPTPLATAPGTATVLSSAPSDKTSLDPSEYFLSSLFRSDHPNPERSNAPARAEAKLIFAHALGQKNLPMADRIYLARLVAVNTGLSQNDAENRVSGVFAQLQQEIEVTRSTIARLFLWLFIALLICAFCASFAATLGGRQRDQVRLLSNR
jgi:hypothetical protein